MSLNDLPSTDDVRGDAGPRYILAENSGLRPPWFSPRLSHPSAVAFANQQTHWFSKLVVKYSAACGGRQMATCRLCGKVLEPGDTHLGRGRRRALLWVFQRGDGESARRRSRPSSFQPVELMDADGVPHTFQIRSMMVPTGHELEAVESTAGEGGYRFAVLGDFETDAWELFHKLYENMRDALSVRHVERTTHGWQIGSDHRLVGRIEWDPATNGRTPLLVIDGRAFTWDEVGKMLMTFEGFTLDARIEDTIELLESRPQRRADS